MFVVFFSQGLLYLFLCLLNDILVPSQKKKKKIIIIIKSVRTFLDIVRDILNALKCVKTQKLFRPPN